MSSFNLGDVTWNFNPPASPRIVEVPHEVPTLLPVRVIRGETMASEDIGVVIDVATRNEIRAQSLQNHSQHDRTHHTALAQLESDAIFFGSLLRAASVDKHREQNAEESVAIKKILEATT